MAQCIEKASNGDILLFFFSAYTHFVFSQLNFSNVTETWHFNLSVNWHLKNVDSCLLAIKRLRDNKTKNIFPIAFKFKKKNIKKLNIKHGDIQIKQQI